MVRADVPGSNDPQAATLQARAIGSQGQPSNSRLVPPPTPQLQSAKARAELGVDVPAESRELAFSSTVARYCVMGIEHNQLTPPLVFLTRCGNAE